MGKICDRIPFESFVVGVSGGVDSLCLADMLWRQGRRGFGVAHCNFHLRGEESDGDAEFVRGWAESRGLAFHRADFDTVGYAGACGVSIEMAARELRYGWFALLCREFGYGAVAIAHNANDNAETLILNLVRGTGLRGICGMQEVSAQTVAPSAGLAGALGHPVEDFPQTLSIWRPLLGMTRDQIEGYARKHGLSWREDRTNRDTEYRRNLIRHEVLPLLERLNPSVVKVLNRDMRHFGEAQAIVEDHFFGDLSGAALPGMATAGAPGGDFGRLLSCIAHRGTGWRYALFLYLERFGFSSAVIGQVEDLLDSGRTVSGKVFRSPTHSLVMGRGGEFQIGPLGLQSSKTASARPEGSGSAAGDGPVSACMQVRENVEIAVDSPGEYSIGGRSLAVEVFDRPEGFSLRQPSGVTALDADRLPFPFVLRGWRNGDWMRPLGCCGRKKVSDLFSDLKFSGRQKREAVFSVRGGNAEDSRVLALVGSRIDESVRITPETVRILRLTLHPGGQYEPK